MMKSASKILAGMLLLLFVSCYYDELYEEPIPDIPDTETISFADDIQPLFESCVGCHNGTVANPDLRPDNAYNNLVPDYVVAGDAEASELYNNLPGNGHPIDVGFTLSVGEIALIKAWIDQGAANN